MLINHRNIFTGYNTKIDFKAVKKKFHTEKKLPEHPEKPLYREEQVHLSSMVMNIFPPPVKEEDFPLIPEKATGSSKTNLTNISYTDNIQGKNYKLESNNSGAIAILPEEPLVTSDLQIPSSVEIDRVTVEFKPQVEEYGIPLDFEHLFAHSAGEISILSLPPHGGEQKALNWTPGEPLEDFFTLKKEDIAKLPKRMDDIKQRATEMKEFNDKFPVDGSVKDVDRFLEEWGNRGLTSGQKTSIMKKFMGLKKEGMARAAEFYEKCIKEDEGFKNLEIPAEYYIVCLNKTDRLTESISFARNHLDKLLKKQFGEKLKENENLNADTYLSKDRRNLYRELGVNGEILGGLGKAFKVISKKATKGQVDQALIKLVEDETGEKFGSDMEKLSRKALEVSRDYYLAGFGVDCEYYPGINAVYNNLQLGDVKHAENLSKMVKYACEREGGKESTDYWCLVTQMEAALISKDNENAVEMFPLVMKKADPNSYLDSTADNLEMLSGLRKEKGENTESLDFVAGKLRERLDKGFPPPPDWNEAEWINKAQAELAKISSVDLESLKAGDVKDAALAKSKAITDKIHDSSFSFKNINSKFVGGNWSFGGIIPDIPVNRTSIKMARNLLQHLGVSDITDFNTWNVRVNDYLDNRFGLVDKNISDNNGDGKSSTIALPDKERVLEDLHSPQHRRMDDFRNNLLEFTHSKTSGDSRTDLMVETALGTVDCRQTAYTKQFLYDVWKRDNQTRLLQQAMDSVYSGDGQTYDSIMKKVNRLSKEQLITVTALIKAPVKMDGMYNTCTDDAGHPLPSEDGKPQDVENHTFNIRLLYDDNENVKTMEARDGFYKGLYPLGYCQLNPEEIMDKETGIYGGNMGVKNSKGEEIPFCLIPTKYSGAKPKESSDECGSVRLGGMEVNPPGEGVFFSDREYVQHLVDAIAGMNLHNKK